MVSERFVHAANLCIVSVDRPSDEATTATGFPDSGVEVDGNTSTCMNGLVCGVIFFDFDFGTRSIGKDCGWRAGMGMVGVGGNQW